MLDEHLTEKRPNHLLSLALNSGFQGLTLTPKALKNTLFLSKLPTHETRLKP